MPSIDPGFEQRQADRIKAYDDAMAAAHAENPPHLTQKAIDACDRCDGDGYRNGVVCDHVDRADVAARGAAACRAALSKLPKS
jgi:hypothetical protein